MSEATPTGETHRHVVMLLTVPNSLEHRLADIHDLALSLQADGRHPERHPRLSSAATTAQVATKSAAGAAGQR